MNMESRDSYTLKTKLTLHVMSAFVAVVTTVITTSFVLGQRVTEDATQRNRNTEEIAQIKKLDEERDHRSDELLRLVVAGFAELRAQMAIVMPRVFGNAKSTWWHLDQGIYAPEEVADATPPQAEVAPFQIKPLTKPVPAKDRLVELENLRQRIIQVRSEIEQFQMSEKPGESEWHQPQIKIEQRRAKEIEYEKLKTQEVILTREILGSI